jgi:hypothetical protein
MKQIGGQQKIECMGTEQTADLAEQSTKHRMEHKEISQASKWQVWALILQHLNFVAVAPSPTTSNFSGGGGWLSEGCRRR